MRQETRGIRFGVLCFAVILGVMFVSPVFAEGNPSDKLKRGVENSFTGWLEIPDGVKEASEQTNPFTALTYGLTQGAGKAVERMGVGAYDMATFLIPDYDKPHMDKERVFSR